MNEIRIYRCEFLQCFSKNVVYVCPQNMSSNINNENETCAFKRIYIYKIGGICSTRCSADCVTQLIDAIA